MSVKNNNNQAPVDSGHGSARITAIILGLILLPLPSILRIALLDQVTWPDQAWAWLWFICIPLGTVLLMFGLYRPVQVKAPPTTRTPPKPTPEPGSWRKGPAAADERVFDLSQNDTGSMVGVHNWQHVEDADRYRYMPDRIYEDRDDQDTEIDQKQLQADKKYFHDKRGF